MAQTDYSAATPLPDDAEEDADTKLLSKDADGRIVAKDMAEVKYSAGDMRNGDARVDIPDTVRTFTGLTKEELRKYAEDPFWVRLRWITFVLFWLLWLCMLAGAVAIIVRSPKCAPLKWYQKGPLVEVPDDADLSLVLPSAERAQAAAVVLPESLLGDVYAERLDLDRLAAIVNEAAKIRVKVVLDVTPNYVSKSHKWFENSEKRINFTDYFLWRNEQGADGVTPSPPAEKAPSTSGGYWKWSDTRKAYYYAHELAAEMPDLNFRNERVKEQFRSVLRRLFGAGIDGVRLLRVPALRLYGDQEQKTADIHHSPDGTSGQLELSELLNDWRRLAEAHKPDALVFLGGAIPETEPYFHVEGGTKRPLLPLPPVDVSLNDSADQIAARINGVLRHWPAIKLTGSGAETGAAAAFALSLPATPVLAWRPAMPDGAYNRTAALRRRQLALPDAAFADVDHVGGDIVATQWSGNNEHFLGLYNIRALNVTADITALKNVSDTVIPYGTADELPSKSLLVPSGFSVYVNKPTGLQ